MGAANAIKKPKTLTEKVKPFVSHAESLDTRLIFEEWMLQSLMQYFRQGTASSFAPFNQYFSTPYDFRQSFFDFLEAEVLGTDDSSAQLERIAVRVIRNMIQYAVDHANDQPGYRDTEPPRLNHFVFELFEVLVDLNSEDAFEWAACALSARTGFAAMIGPNGSPAPLELYFSLIGNDMAGHDKARFLTALLEWCNMNAERPEVPPAARDLLPTVLRSIGGINRAHKQIELLTRLSSPHNGAFGLIILIEPLISEEETQLHEPLYEIELDNIRKSVDSEVPALVTHLDEDTKSKWRFSSILGDAFRNELGGLGNQSNIDSAPLSPLSERFGDGSLLQTIKSSGRILN